MGSILMCIADNKTGKNKAEDGGDLYQRAVYPLLSIERLYTAILLMLIAEDAEKLPGWSLSKVFEAHP